MPINREIDLSITTNIHHVTSTSVEVQQLGAEHGRFDTVTIHVYSGDKEVMAISLFVAPGTVLSGIQYEPSKAAEGS